MRPIDVTPDWICEVVSPSTAARDRVAKRALYAAHGVSFYWLIDPNARTLEALALESGHWRELGAWDDTATVNIAPFNEVGRLFLPRDADPPQRDD